MKALIFQNKVVDLQENEFPCSPEMVWIDCDDPDAKIGYGYSDGTLHDDGQNTCSHEP